MAAPQVRSEVVVRRAGHPGRGESWIAIAWGPCEAGQANGYGTRVMDREGTSREQKRQAGWRRFPFQARPRAQHNLPQDYCPPFSSGRAWHALPLPTLLPRSGPEPSLLPPLCRLFNTGIARGYEREWSAGGEKGSRWHHPSRSRRRPRHMEREGESACV